MVNDIAPQPVPNPLPDADVRSLLAASHDLLGRRTPLPALYEEVLRAWRGRPVGTARLRRAEALWERMRQWPGGVKVVRAVITDPRAGAEDRLLAATLWAHARPELPLPFPAVVPSGGDDPEWLYIAMALLTHPDSGERFAALLETLLADQRRGPRRLVDRLPDPLPLLGFLHGLHTGALSSANFRDCVLVERVLHPAVAAHRPLQRLHRLLDYLGFSADPVVQGAYRQLTAEVWPLACAENWTTWQWISVPGGPDVFPRALRAVGEGDRTLVRLHELKHAPLPPPEMLSALLEHAETPVVVLLCWLRPTLAKAMTARPALAAALGWMHDTNPIAAETAYTAPPWWDSWLQHELPAARQVLGWLQRLALPPPCEGEPTCARHQWLEQHLTPGYPHITANLLLAQAARGEGLEEITVLADDGCLPAVRALALAPSPDDALCNLLRRLRRTGGRPLQAAARRALEHLARRRGLSGVEELDRQHLLSAAWELGPLAGERVRVGWQDGSHRMRLSLHAGKVRLDVLGPGGPVTRIPAALRAGDTYRQARAAQRETQAQYRLFRRHLEQRLLEGAPCSTGEFRYLCANPVFAHLAERLVWRTSERQDLLWAAPERWETLEGETVDLSSVTLTLTLVHPVALAEDGTLGAWQALAADRRLVQPLRQVFREVYTVEGETGTHCWRFAGRRLEPGRAYAVLRAAACAPGNGTARREWPHGVTAHLCWAHAAAGRDLFGPQRKAEVSSGEIWFTRGDTVLPLHHVDPVIFSETLRTADLLATRAAMGEAELTSRETVALRALLLREAARSFQLTNIAVPEDGRYALVLGSRATYRINLASGTVFLEPEGRQILVPHHNASWQPVEEGDSTSEILALTLDLAHDDTLGDLTFLAQL